jgi:ubiquinol-cytochrome c reductase cytochrome c1 subunit
MSFRKLLSPLACAALLFGMALAAGESAQAAGSAKEPRQLQWPFEGVFGTFDRQAAQRGYQVYKEVCASCHAMKRIHFRNLTAIGFSEAEVKTIAAEYSVVDGPNEDGEMFERPGRPADAFVSPYPNQQAARAANGGAYPPDLSLMVKARHDGANYIYSLLTGYTNPPEGFELTEGKHYNPYFPGGQIAMAPPIAADQVTYQDGTQASVDQMAKDLVVFLQWAAEPEMEHRKSMGIKVMIFLFLLTVFFYAAKRRIWSRIGH